MIHPHEDLTRITLKVLFIGGLLVASFWVIQPFLPAIIWAMTLVVATWPLMIWVQRHAGNSRGIAVLVMTLALLLVLIVPLGLAISTIVANIDQIGDLARTIPPTAIAATTNMAALRTASKAPAWLRPTESATSVSTRELSGWLASSWYHGVISTRATTASAGAATRAPAWNRLRRGVAATCE